MSADASKNIIEFIRMTLKKESKVSNTIKYVFVGNEAPLVLEDLPDKIIYLA